jgi:hypothetical protein
MGKPWVDRDLKPKVEDILSNANKYHKKFYQSKTFSGPSLHFHRRALGLDKAVRNEEKYELIYAALTSWGMHRMGAKGSKMQSFPAFVSSIKSVRPFIVKLQKKTFDKITGNDWLTLERVFKEINVMASGTSIVGNSKVLAHLLPNLFVPVDREYTLQFLFEGKTLKNDLDNEWILMKKILNEFFYPVANCEKFKNQAALWQNDQKEYPWDTSTLKIIDNLVIGALKS